MLSDEPVAVAGLLVAGLNAAQQLGIQMPGWEHAAVTIITALAAAGVTRRKVTPHRQTTDALDANDSPR